MRWVRHLPDNPPPPRRETKGGSLAGLLASGQLGARLIAAAQAGAAQERAWIALTARESGAPGGRP